MSSRWGWTLPSASAADALGRAAPAAGAGPGDTRRSGRSPARRLHQCGLDAETESRVRRALVAAAARAHHAHRLPQGGLPPARRPHRRPGRGTDRRAWDAPRADGPGRLVRADLSPSGPVPGAHPPQRGGTRAPGRVGRDHAGAGRPSPRAARAPRGRGLERVSVEEPCICRAATVRERRCREDRTAR